MHGWHSHMGNLPLHPIYWYLDMHISRETGLFLQNVYFWESGPRYSCWDLSLVDLGVPYNAIIILASPLKILWKWWQILWWVSPGSRQPNCWMLRTTLKLIGALTGERGVLLQYNRKCWKKALRHLGCQERTNFHVFGPCLGWPCDWYLSKVTVYNSNKPHRYGNSHATW